MRGYPELAVRESHHVEEQALRTGQVHGNPRLSGQLAPLPERGGAIRQRRPQRGHHVDPRRRPGGPRLGGQGHHQRMAKGHRRQVHRRSNPGRWHASRLQGELQALPRRQVGTLGGQDGELHRPILVARLHVGLQRDLNTARAARDQGRARRPLAPREGLPEGGHAALQDARARVLQDDGRDGLDIATGHLGIPYLLGEAVLARRSRNQDNGGMFLPPLQKIPGCSKERAWKPECICVDK